MLTEYQWQILESVKDGVDVCQHGIANACRLLEQKGLAEICHSNNVEAFFYCVATDAGKEALNG